MKPFVPEYIFIENASVNDPLTERVLNRFHRIPYEIISDGNNIKIFKNSSFAEGKRTLLLKRCRGQFIERCPSTRFSLCCNYYVAHLAINCPFECTYCCLQSYLSNQALIVHTNISDFLAEVETFVSAHPGENIRLGTGELADSLALDEFTEFSKEIIPLLSNYSNLLLELKTKSNFIANLLSIKEKERCVIAWSLNPQHIIDTEEYKTASLIERLKAARKCDKAGYKLAFHFDPIILFDGWENEYQQVVNLLFEYVNPDNILWISLGGLRFTQAGKNIIQKRFPKSSIIYEEFVQCPDGKYRYLQQVRTEVYRTMHSWLSERAHRAFIYLCMESPAMWKRVYGENSRIVGEIQRF